MPPVDSAVAVDSASALERVDTGSRATDSPATLHHQFLAQAALANRNTHRLMELIRRMEACDGHVEYACPTLAHYLELVCGVSRIAGDFCSSRRRSKMSRLSRLSFHSGRLSDLSRRSSRLVNSHRPACSCAVNNRQRIFAGRLRIRYSPSMRMHSSVA